MTMAIPLGQFPVRVGGYTNIQPFTYRDGLTYLEVLEDMRGWLYNELVPHLDNGVDELVKSVNFALEAVDVALTSRAQEDVVQREYFDAAKIAFDAAAETANGNLNALITEAEAVKTSIDQAATGVEADVTASETARTGAELAATNATVKAEAARLSAEQAALVGVTSAAIMEQVFSDPNSAPSRRLDDLIGNYQAESKLLFARMSERPNSDRRAAINTLIVALKDWGIWAQLDNFYVLGAHNAQAALLNWRADARNLVAVNSPNFTQDRGYAGDGATSAIRTDIFSTTGLHLNPDSASFGMWSLTDSILASAGADIAIGNSSGGTGSHKLTSRTTSIFSYTANQAQRTVAQATSLGLFAANRSASGVSAQWNGARVDSGALVAPTASNPMGDLYVHIGRAGSTYSARRYAMAFTGGSLTDVQHAALYAVVRDYLRVLGAV